MQCRRARGRGRGLPKCQGEGRALIGFVNRQARRSGLGVPAFELAQIAPGGIFKHRQPIFNCCRIAIMALEIQIKRAGIAIIAHQGFQHPNDLSAFFIDGGGVEIIDF